MPCWLWTAAVLIGACAADSLPDEGEELPEQANALYGHSCTTDSQCYTAYDGTPRADYDAYELRCVEQRCVASDVETAAYDRDYDPEHDYDPERAHDDDYEPLPGPVPETLPERQRRERELLERAQRLETERLKAKQRAEQEALEDARQEQLAKAERLRLQQLAEDEKLKYKQAQERENLARKHRDEKDKHQRTDVVVDACRAHSDCPKRKTSCYGGDDGYVWVRGTCQNWHCEYAAPACTDPDAP